MIPRRTSLKALAACAVLPIKAIRSRVNFVNSAEFLSLPPHTVLFRGVSAKRQSDGTFFSVMTFYLNPKPFTLVYNNGKIGNHPIRMNSIGEIVSEFHAYQQADFSLLTTMPGRPRWQIGGITLSDEDCLAMNLPTSF